MPDIYNDSTYLGQNPTWHEEDSAWKARQVLKMLKRHDLPIRKIAEIGCGVGAILRELHDQLQPDLEFQGFDISKEAIARARTRQTARLQFFEEDLLRQPVTFDLMLVIDVFEHVPDYLGFLDLCRSKARYKLFHIPLDIHVSSVIRAAFVKGRYSVGHLHYFTSESALAALSGAGYQVLDWFFTDGALALAGVHPRFKTYLANIPRRAISIASTAWAARLLGGYSLMVLAE